MTRKVMHPIDQLVHCTIQITTEREGKTLGRATGFVVGFPIEENKGVLMVVTNKHAVKEADTCIYHMTVADEQNLPIVGLTQTIRVRNFQWIDHPNPDVDLCVFPLNNALAEAEKLGLKLFYVSLPLAMIPQGNVWEEFFSIEDIVMVGYPAGIRDNHNNFPIIRKGITATPISFMYENRPEFLIDVAAFPGSSGSPVFLYNVGIYPVRTPDLFRTGGRFMLLGILSSGHEMPLIGDIFDKTDGDLLNAEAFSQIPINLGVAIRADQLFAFEPIIRSKFTLD